MDRTLKKIVVGLEQGELAERTLAEALELAAAQAPAEVHAIRVLELALDPIAGALPSTTAEIESLKAMLQEGVARAIRERGALEVSSVVAHVAIGAPARAIADLAAQLDADLVVVGTHGRRGLRRALLGSVAEEVVRTSGCPVLCVRPKNHPDAARVPNVEPLCSDCAEKRAQTQGAQLWCERHASHHPRAHVYHYERSVETLKRPVGLGPS